MADVPIKPTHFPATDAIRAVRDTPPATSAQRPIREVSFPIRDARAAFTAQNPAEPVNAPAAIATTSMATISHQNLHQSAFLSAT